jgi:hypothetical protein
VLQAVVADQHIHARMLAQQGKTGLDAIGRDAHRRMAALCDQRRFVTGQFRAGVSIDQQRKRPHAAVAAR